MNQHRLYRFDTFCLDATAKVLLRDGTPVTMTRRAVETLMVLVENSGQVVPKEELLSAIWPDRVVDEANLTQNIAMVRRALSAEHGSPAYIETFPGRGYRIVGPVTIEQATTAPETGRAPAETVEETSADTLIHFNQPAAERSKDFSGKDFSGVAVWRIFGPRFAAYILLPIAVLAAAWFFWSRKEDENETVFRVTSLTRLAGRETQPALSPDGNRVAFLWEQDDGRPPELRVQTDSSTASLRIGSQQSHYSSPAWSPDGQALAYLRIGKEATAVLTVALHGDEIGRERLVTEFSPPNYGLQYRMLDWSPDGQWLAVSHSETPDKPNGLFLVNLATGEKKVLTKPEGLVGGDLDPRFASDGRRLTFIRHIHRSHQELYSIPVSGGSPQPLTNDAKQISGHAWLDDGSGIIFSSDRSGEFRLWKLGATSSAPQRIEIFGAFPISLSIARRAPVLAYVAEQQVRNLWRLDLQTKSWTRVVASSAQDASPQYSPDGRKICFRSDRAGDEQLWVSDADGGNPTQITLGSLYPSVGHWSPDGRQIVFNNARSGEMFAASLNENGSWSVGPTGGNGVHPVFSPDGQWIYAGGARSIIKIPVAGGRGTEVVATGGHSLGISRDGLLLFFKRDPNDSLLWQVRTDTGEISRALDGLLPGCTSCWALTPQGVYYLGSDKTSFDAQAIYFHRFGSAEPDRLIVKYPEPLAPVGSGPFSLSPDLKYLLCVRMNPSNSDIMRVKPFR